jgi:hypothetical protein
MNHELLNCLSPACVAKLQCTAFFYECFGAQRELIANLERCEKFIQNVSVHSMCHEQKRIVKSKGF